MSFIPNANRGAGAGGSRCRNTGRRVRQAWFRPGAGAAIATAAAATAMAAAAALALTAPAASASSAASASIAARTAPATQRAYGLQVLPLHAMPVGTVRFGRAGHGRLTVHARVSGLTPGSSHAVDLRVPGHSRLIRFSTLTANNVGQASSTLHSHFSGPLRRGSRLLVRMGAQGGRLASTPIARTRWLRDPGGRTHRLTAGISTSTREIAAISSAMASPPSTSGRCYVRTSTAVAAAARYCIGEPNWIRFPSGSMCAPCRS